MKLLNLGWMALAMLACLLPPDPPALYGAIVWISLLAFCGHGPGLYQWVVAVGVVAIVGQPEPTWFPLTLGAVVGAYNLGGIRPFTPAVALSQAIVVLAPMPGLPSCWEEIACGIVGVCLAGFCAVSVSTLVHLYEEVGVFEVEVLRPQLRGQE